MIRVQCVAGMFAGYALNLKGSHVVIVKIARMTPMNRCSRVGLVADTAVVSDTAEVSGNAVLTG